MKHKIKLLIELKNLLKFQVLHELNKKGLCGEELAKLMGLRKGSLKLTPGTIYPALKSLKKKGLIKGRKYGRKKIYTITPEGKQQYKLMKSIFRKMFSEFLPKKKKKKIHKK